MRWAVLFVVVVAVGAVYAPMVVGVAVLVLAFIGAGVVVGGCRDIWTGVRASRRAGNVASVVVADNWMREYREFPDVADRVRGRIREPDSGGGVVRRYRRLRSRAIHVPAGGGALQAPAVDVEREGPVL